MDRPCSNPAGRPYDRDCRHCGGDPRRCDEPRERLRELDARSRAHDRAAVRGVILYLCAVALFALGLWGRGELPPATGRSTGPISAPPLPPPYRSRPR